MFGQEGDENNMASHNSLANKIADLELKHEERKNLINRWCSEKCQLHKQNILLKNKLQQIENNEIKLKSKLLNKKKRLSLLETENTALNEQLDKIKQNNVPLEFQVQEIPQLRLKELELDSKNEQIIDLVQKIDCLENKNKYLRDQNEELAVELEATKMIENMSAGSSCDSYVSNLLEEKNSPNHFASCFGKVEDLTTKFSVEEGGSNCINTFETIECDFVTKSKVGSAQKSHDKSTQTPLMLENNVKTTPSSQTQIESCCLDKLIDDMEHLKQISKSDHSLHAKQNESPESTNCRESLDISMTLSPLNKYSTRSPLNKQFENSTETEFIDSTLIEMTNDSVEKLKEMYSLCKSENQELQNMCEKIEKFWESRCDQVFEITDKALNEAKRLKDKCTELELSMEALSNEYFECEECWLLKLEEEHKLNELEKKDNHEKLNNLEAKIKEYKDMLEEMTNNRLPSIDEHVELEEQINCIQLEFSNYRVKNEKVMKQLKIENERLKSLIVIPDEKIDCEVANGQFKGECEKYLKNINGEFKNNQFDSKNNHEKPVMEHQSLMHQRRALQNEIAQLQEYLHFLSICQAATEHRKIHHHEQNSAS